MTNQKATKFKKGAASFYMVAFSTLILIIIAASFAAIVISQLTRASNDDLSQSAYDSALAGIEDAKIAFYNYQNCLRDGSLENCKNIIKYMENPEFQDCDMVARMIGRIAPNEEGHEIIIEESKVASNNMQQAYTCVKITTSLKDYRSTISSSNQTKVARVKFDNVKASQIKKMKISWFSNTTNSDFHYTNFNTSTNKISYPSSSLSIKTATPPTISLSLVQTAENFVLDDFNMTQGNTTNRGTLFLTPITVVKNNADDKGEAASKSVADNYIAGYNKDLKYNYINKNGFLKSNNKTSKNLPYGVYCPYRQESEFACEVTIELPDPVGGARSNDTFMFVVGLPYGKPSTDFALEFFCADGKVCHTDRYAYENENGETVTETTTTSQANLKGAQIEIDSTGRANDLFRRIQARLEGMDDNSLSIMGPLELLGKNGSVVLQKDDVVVTEFNFN